ncbi:MAG: hypothetical protein R3250_07665 [Melioribacteraceae bacterium]|nr:hypothetical protein [Melioribacteraceae bacterium]
MKKVIVSVIILILLVTCYGVYMFTKKTPSLQKVTPDYIVTADDLFDEFESDEKNSIMKYESQVIQVSGTILMVTKTDSISNVILNAKDAIMGGVNCSFNKLEDSLQNGDTVTIKGRCQGYLTNVILNNCVIVK